MVGADSGMVPPMVTPSREHISPVRRAARLLMLLLRSPHSLEELRDTLGISPAQLRNDIHDLRAEGWPIEDQQTYVEADDDTQMQRRGPKILWIPPGSIPSAKEPSHEPDLRLQAGRRSARDRGQEQGPDPSRHGQDVDGPRHRVPAQDPADNRPRRKGRGPAGVR